MNKNEAAYWIALAGLPRWGSEKINRLIIRIITVNDITLDEFFGLPEEIWKKDYDLGEKEITDLTTARASLPNNSFLAENLYNQGFEIIPVTYPEYPPQLKINLKTKLSPPVIYIKGNKEIFREKSVAIAGSREASEISLKFTDNIARKAAKEFKVIVSGFAKGIDRQALESALKYKGQSIVVLPQGILTFGSGIKKYYEQIVEGNIVVLSVFHPRAPWSTGLAMARNPIIYGLASEIYIAQSGDSGGTWEGAISGLKTGRIIYVRNPEKGEQNANSLLIEKGAVPVDFEGIPIYTVSASGTDFKDELNTSEKIEDSIIRLFNPASVFTAKEIKNKLNTEISLKKINEILKASEKLVKVSARPAKYKLKNDSALKLNFDD